MIINSSDKAIIEALRKRLEEHNSNRIFVQNELRSLCTQLKREVDDMEVHINSKLQTAFEAEDARLQILLNEIYETLKSYDAKPCSSREDMDKLMKMVKAELFVVQGYTLSKVSNPTGNDHKYELNVTKSFSTELLREKKDSMIEDVKVSGISNNSVFLTFKSPISESEKVAIEKSSLWDRITYRVNMHEVTEDNDDNNNNNNHDTEYVLNKTNNSFLPDPMKVGVRYDVKVKAEVENAWHSEWSVPVSFIPQFSDLCDWKKCPEKVSDDRKYSIVPQNTRIATKTSGSGYWSTVAGSAPIPKDKVVSWNVKVLKSKRGDGNCIMVGVAPSDIDQNADRNFEKCGHYFNCFESTLFFGPPRCFKGKDYGPRKEVGQYVHTGDTVNVTIDTVKGELTFGINGVSLGVAYEGIPLNKPLVPCVILGHKGDSVELSFNKQ